MSECTYRSMRCYPVYIVNFARATVLRTFPADRRMADGGFDSNRKPLNSHLTRDAIRASTVHCAATQEGW